MIVNDRKSDLLALREALLPLGEPLLTAESAREGLRAAEQNDLAVAIIDIRMPGTDGLAMVEILRRDRRHADLPVMFVSALEVTAEIAKRVYALGAADLVMLPVVPEMLRSKVAVFVKLHRHAAREQANAVEVREAAASEVQTQQERFRVFFESSAAGYALLDPTSHRFLSVNPRFCEIVGRGEEELRGLTFEDITFAGDRGQDAQQIGALFAGAVNEVAIEKRYVRPNGTMVWILLTTSIVRDAHGAAKLQVSVVQDITARKVVEMQLAESRTRLRLAVEVADLGVFYHDGTRGTVAWNEQFKQLIGLQPGEQESVELLRARIHPEDRPAAERKMAEVLHVSEEPTEWEMTYRVIRPDGTMRWLKTNGVSEPRLAPDGTRTSHSVGATRDITAEKEFEAELQRQIAQRTRELDEKTRQLESFAYTVAHDLRAPLRAINGYADYALEDIAGLGRSQAENFLDRIRKSTQRLDALVADLLSYSRLSQQIVEVERVDLNRVVQRVQQELENEIERSDAQVVVHPAIPPVQGEPSILEQVIANLVGNALKFTPEGEPPHVEIFAEDGDGQVRLNVRDHGIGIPREYQERIFRVFERLQSSRDYPGTGIGLAIVARGVERMGGRFGVESEPGQGSTFWIELKRAA